jgi:hypothetical protein
LLPLVCTNAKGSGKPAQRTVGGKSDQAWIVRKLLIRLLDIKGGVEASYGIRLMRSFGVPEGQRKRPVKGPDAALRKIDNFLPSRLALGIVFQNADQPGWHF